MVAAARSSHITNVPPSYYARPEKEVQAYEIFNHYFFLGGSTHNSFFSSDFSSNSSWLDSKRVDDDIENGLWRIKNTLYDLNAFIEKHPGGADWIRMTKGHDITEAFIIHHIAMEKVEPFLKKYRVKDTEQPRNVKLTFDDDGFYMTLRRKVVANLPEIKKTTKIYSNASIFSFTRNSLRGNLS